jgi:hypothetical protein
MLKLILTTQPFADYCQSWQEPTDAWGGIGEHPVQVLHLDHPGTVEDLAVYRPADMHDAPVLVFLHGWLADSDDRYAFLFERLASNGFVVVFAPYTADYDLPHEQRFEEIQLGVSLALEHIGPAADPGRMGWFGHSYGAGAIPESASRGVAQGWGSEGLLLFPMAPWYAFGEGVLPSHTVTVLQSYASDEVVDPAIAAQDIWSRLPESSLRVWQVVEDRHTSSCRAPAGHLTPGTHGGWTFIRGQRAQRIDAHDVWSTARHVHAAAALAFGLPNSAGAWNVGVGVDPLDSAVQTLSSPPSSQGGYIFGPEGHCEYTPEGCPLSD